MLRTRWVVGCALVAGLTACTPPPKSVREVVERGEVSDARAVLAWVDATRGPSTSARAFVSHPSAEVRAYSLLVIGRLGHDGFDAVLQDGLDDTDPLVRRHAAFALGQWRAGRGCRSPGRAEHRRGWGTTGAALATRLKAEKHPLVRMEIYRALGRCPGGLDRAAVDAAAPMDRPHAVVAFGLQASRERGQEAPRWLIALLDDEDAEVRAAAYYALSRMRVALTPALQDKALLALSASGSEREAALRLLVNPTDERTRELRLADLDLALTPHAQAFLLQRGDNRLAADLMGRALSRFRVAPGLEPLADATGADYARAVEWHTLIAGARVLKGRFRDAIGVSLARIWQPEALGRRTQELLCGHGFFGDDDPCALSDRLAGMGAQASPGLVLAGLESQDRATRHAALAAINARSPSSLRNAVLRLVADRDGPTRALAAQAISRMGLDPQAVAAICAAFEATPAADVEVAGTLLMVLLDDTVKGATCVARVRSVAAEGPRALRDLLDRPMTEPAPPAFVWADVSKYAHDSSPVRVRFATSSGEIVMQLERRFTPNTTRNLVRLVEAGHFDGLTFHRTVPHFVIQGGDPRGDGWGGPGYSIADENVPTSYVTGTVGMALAGRDTGGSQFFVALSPQPHLYGTYPAFGRVVEGLDVALRVFAGDTIERAWVD